MSKLQPTVSVSTCEAEYIAAAAAIKEGLWLRTLFGDFGVIISPLQLFGDNQGALKLLSNPLSNVRSKHIDIAHHFARERVMRREVSINYISTDSMVADILTKAVPKEKVILCRSALGLK